MIKSLIKKEMVNIKRKKDKKKIIDLIDKSIISLSEKNSIFVYHYEKIRINSYFLFLSLSTQKNKKAYEDCLKILKAKDQNPIKLYYWVLLEAGLIKIKNKKLEINE